MTKLTIKLDPGEVRAHKQGLVWVAVTGVPKGHVWFYFKEFAFARQSVECLMEIEVVVQDEHHETFSQRIDLHSASARRSLSTDLNAAYGNKAAGYNWVLILNNVFTKIVRNLSDEQQPICVSEDEYKEIPFLLYPFLQENVSNLIFAQSEAGKTWFALRMALSLAMKHPFFSYSIILGAKTLFLDYEDDIATFRNRLHKLCRGAGLNYKEAAKQILYYKPTGSLRTNVEMVRKIVSEHGITFIIIDAGGDAAGGSPSDEEKVLDLFNALEEIKATKLILHHEPKNVQNEAAAFYGSTYWKGRSRVAWRLEVESQEGGDKLIKTTIQKRSNLPYIEPIYYRMSFPDVTLDNMLSGVAEDLVPSVVFVSEQLKVEQKGLDTILVEEIEKGDVSEGQLAQLVGRDRSTVGKRLRDMEFKGVLKKIRKGKSVLWTAH